MSFLIAQLLLDGPAEFFQLQTLYGLVLFSSVAKVLELLGLEILERMGQRGPTQLAELLPPAAVPEARMRKALGRR